MKCKECKFWANNESFPTEDFAEANFVLRADCHRFPDYQERHENDWCGEFKSKPTPTLPEHLLRAIGYRDMPEGGY